jgi:hypothetical protein
MYSRLRRPGYVTERLPTGVARLKFEIHVVEDMQQSRAGNLQGEGLQMPQDREPAKAGHHMAPIRLFMRPHCNSSLPSGGCLVPSRHLVQKTGGCVSLELSF